MHEQNCLSQGEKKVFRFLLEQQTNQKQTQNQKSKQNKQKTNQKQKNTRKEGLGPSEMALWATSPDP